MARKPPRPARGRKRDASVDQRITAAAVALYGEVGWAGFHFDALARRSKVGKAALYLRWRSEEDVLKNALHTLALRVAPAPAGDLQAGLLDLGRQVFALYTGATGRALQRLRVERDGLPRRLKAWHDAYSSELVLAARGLVRGAVRRGELPAGTSTTLLLDTLLGAIEMHVGATPRALRPRMLARSEAYLQDLVAFVLGAVRVWPARARGAGASPLDESGAGP